MASYQGSARSVRFDPIKQPDNASRIYQAGMARVQSLKEAYQADINQKNIYNAAVEKAQNQEILQRKQNIQVEQEWERAYARQLKKNYNAAVKREVDKSKQEYDALSRLGDFSKTALDLGQGLYEDYKQDRKDYGMLLASQFNITPQDLIELTEGEADLKAENTANNAVINRLKAAGASPDQLEAIRKLDGYALYGAEQFMAENAGQEWLLYLQNPENRRKAYDIGEAQPMSLEEAMMSNDQAKYLAVRNAMQMEWARPYGKINQGFAQKYLWPNVRKVNEVDNSNFLTKSGERWETQEYDRLSVEVNNLESELETNPSAVNELLLRQAGGKTGEIRTVKIRETLESISKMVADGVVSTKLAKEILASPITINGSSKSLAETYRKSGSIGAAVKALEDAVIKEDQVNNDRIKTAQELKAKEMLEEYRAIEPDLTQKQKIAFARSFEDKFAQYGVQFPKDLQDRLRGVRPLEAQVAMDQGYAMAAAGTLTIEDLDSERFSALTPQQKETLTRIAGRTSGNRTVENGELRDAKRAIKSALMKRAGSYQTTDVNVAVDAMVLRANELLLQLYQQQAIVKGPRDALFDAQQMVIQQIDNDQGIFETIKDPATGKTAIGDDFGFLISQQSIDDTRLRTLDAAIDSYISDKNAPETARLLGKYDPEDNKTSLIETLNSEVRASNQPPEWLRKLADRIPTMTWKELANAQLRAYGLPEIPALRDEEAAEVVLPSYRKLMKKFGTPGKTSRALLGTQKDSGVTDGIERYKPMLDLMASVESQNDTVHGGYDALNREGTADGYPIGTSTGYIQFGRPLTEMTWGEIRGMQRRGEVHALGRYQFINSTLQDMEDRYLLPIGITDDTLFDEKLQDRLAIAYLNDSISYYQDTNGRVIEGLGHRWIGLKNVAPEKIQAALDHIKKVPAFESVQLNPNVAEVFYIAGDVMPGGAKSEHTDVKQQDNLRTPESEHLAYFEDSDLDNYIHLDDPDHGVIPFSKLRELHPSPNTGFYAMRDGGTRQHSGYDYGTKSGTKLALKNGAKLISVTPTAWGDKAVIELPNGKRFSFLHGKGVS